MKTINWLSANVGRRLGLAALGATCLMGWARTADAMQPLRPGEMDTLKQQGVWEQRLAAARKLGNDRLGDDLAVRAANKIFRARLESYGFAPSEAESIAPLPPPLMRGLPTTGTPKMLTVLLSFPDFPAPASPTVANIGLNTYGIGSAEAQANFSPLESLNRYFYRASETKLDIGGNVLPWHQMPNARATYTPVNNEPDSAVIFSMLKAALQANAAHDFTQYDNDGDGDIDVINIIWTGPTGAWATFWWGYKSSFVGVPEASSTFFDGKTAREFTWQWLATRGATDSDYDPRVIIHETGHSLGLPDYYDYDGSVGPDGGVGGLDMMDANRGNHNAFSRWVLDWITPTIVGAGPPALRTLNASGDISLTTDKAVVVFPNAASTPFGEFFMVENRQRVGNDAGISSMPSDGLVVWHVDGTLDPGGDYFIYNNSFSARKLLRLMEADGLEEIERGMDADPGDYYNAGDEFTPDSNPDSYAYDGTDTSVSITSISANAAVMTAMIGFEGVATVAKPVFTPGPGKYTGPITVSIQCLTPGATIHYTTDGSVPTASSPIYTAPIAVNSDMTIMAIGTLALFSDSPVSTAVYRFVAATPTLSPKGGLFADPVAVTISCNTPGATIRYTTDGTTPTTASPLYTAPVNLSTDTTLRARAFFGGFADSGVASGTYNFVSAAYLTDGVAKTGLAGALGSLTYYRINVPVNQAQLLVKTSNGSGDCDMYVRFGTPPLLDQFDFRPLRKGNKEAVTVNVPEAGIWYIMLHGYKAYAGLSLLADSVPPTSKVKTPVIKPSGGTYYGPVKVTMTCKTSGATIRWTSDGTPPGPYSTLYTGPITVSATSTIKAAAFKPGMLDSSIATVAYTITTPPIETISDGVAKTGLSGATGSMKYFKISVPAGRPQLFVKTYGGKGDCDLYVRFGSSPTLSAWDYRPLRSGNVEAATISDPAAGDWYIMLHGFKSYSKVTLLGDY